ncbi:DUF308 domain-containing protein [Candidatus Saccharibacteria bacterium]|nr:DUF308 domain-containing protein [Candidatus Saccharibacteria bacterium]
MSKAEVIKHPAEEISGGLKKNAWGAILESLITLILGILIVAWPETTIKVVAYVVGVYFIIKGAYQVINYFIVKGQNDFFNNNLLSGVVALLIGLALLMIGEEIINVFRIIIGIWLIYEALVRINTSIKLHTANIPAWKYTLILALMMLVVGIFITFNAGAVVVLVGWMMILASIIGIVGDVMFIQYVGKVADAVTGKTKKEK